MSISVGNFVVAKPGGGLVMITTKREGTRFFCVSIDKQKLIQTWFEESELIVRKRAALSFSY